LNDEWDIERAIRAIYEIDRERFALKAVRRDFDRVPQSADKAAAAMEAGGL
jgi:hypothetical protein